jgi:uncharacterized RDD family membrane protein YckC
MGAAAPSYERVDAAVRANNGIATECEPTPMSLSTSHYRRAVQTSLFARRGEHAKIVSISPGNQAPPVRREPSKRTPGHRPTIHVSSQQQFHFAPPELEGRHSNGTSIEAVIYCNDPVASITHRLLASVADLALIAIAVGLFAVAFLLAGGEVLINRQTAIVYASIPLIIGVFYKYLWAIAGADSPGMAWAGLRTVNFDGKKPDVLQRVLRMAGGFLGLAATGIGLMWAFVDEETLTWHDHISNTFTTPA